MNAVALRTLAIALFCVVPHVGAAQGQRVREVEPNNDPAHANTIRLGETITGEVDSLYQADYFGLDLAGATNLRVILRGGALEQAGANVSILDKNGQAVEASNWWAIDGRDRELYYPIAEAGHYHLIVVSYTAEGPRDYQLAVGVGTRPRPPGDPTRALVPQLDFRRGLTSDAAGNLYVNRGNSGVLKVAPDGSITPFITSLQSGENTWGPLAIDGFGDLLVAGTGYWDNAYRKVIWRYPRSGERTVFAWDVDAASVALDANGDVWISEDEGGRIFHFDPLGNRLATFIAASSCDTPSSPTNLVFSPAGILHYRSCSGIYALVNGRSTLVFPRFAVGLGFDRDGYFYVGTLWPSSAVVLLTPDYQMIQPPIARQFQGDYYLTGMFGRELEGTRLFVATGDGELGQIVELNPAGLRAPGYNAAARFSLLVNDIHARAPQGERFTDTVTVQGLNGAIAWKRIGGSLPPGLTLDDHTGIIRGTPTDSGSFVLLVKATNGDRAGFGRVSIVSSAAAPLAIVSDSMRPLGAVGMTYVDTLKGTGGTGAYAWSITSGGIPPYLTLDAQSGVLHGTPTYGSDVTFQATVTSGVQTATRVFRLHIGSFVIASERERPAAVMGALYADQLSVSPVPTSALTWRLSGGLLPRGLSFWRGTVSGIPRESGSFTYTVAASIPGEQLERTFTLTVTEPVLVKDRVMEQLLGARGALTDTQIRYLDYVGNNNDSLDIGDVIVWLKKMRTGS